ncbi:AMP-binding enzyme C-terminal domain-containing protein [Burkholderia sp. YR290]|jgi:acyl-CoA synthetase (AMP-forming)/AMP-acid ligase II|nr:AMP-binding enzyme C-terminal domain-containing protein [Paraburkholderia hospita]SOE89239.1 AMP-binding enzyme C-terminal domain-containing protein [Burkholderia sp. YR290]
MTPEETFVPAMRRIHEAFAQHAVTRPNQSTLADESRTLNYGELGEAVDALAQRLRDAGVRAGDRVLLVTENCVAAAACLLALSKLDAWSVAVNARVSLHKPDAEGVGELWARGPGLMKGYYRAPEATAEAVTQDGWLRTGDLARVDPDGAVWIVGREKDLIIRSGFNVYPVEVEQVLNAFPGIVQSAVVGRTADGNEDVVAYIEPVPGSTPDPDALRAYLRARLSPYKVPSEIVARTVTCRTHGKDFEGAVATACR